MPRYLKRSKYKSEIEADIVKYLLDKFSPKKASVCKFTENTPNLDQTSIDHDYSDSLVVEPIIEETNSLDSNNYIKEVVYIPKRESRLKKYIKRFFGLM